MLLILALPHSAISLGLAYIFIINIRNISSVVSANPQLSSLRYGRKNLPYFLQSFFAIKFAANLFAICCRSGCELLPLGSRVAAARVSSCCRSGCELLPLGLRCSRSYLKAFHDANAPGKVDEYPLEYNMPSSCGQIFFLHFVSMTKQNYAKIKILHRFFFFLSPYQ